MKITKDIIANNKITKVNIGNKQTDKETPPSGSIELDIENQAEFLEHINKILEENNSNIIIDMKNISYIDSSGLWAIFESHKKATQKKRTLILLKPEKDVQRVLNITKISTKIKTFENEEIAIKFLLEQ